MYLYGFVKKCYEKYKQDTFSMPKAKRQTRLNHSTKEERNAASHQVNIGSYKYKASVLIFEIHLIITLTYFSIIVVILF